jgi:hypothetical protein
MKIAFMFERQNEIRNFSSVVEAALARGHEVQFWLGQTISSDSSKAYLKPTQENIPLLEVEGNKPELYFYSKPSQISDLLEEQKADVLCSINFPPNEYISSETRTKYAVIQFGIDSILRTTYEAIQATDLFFVYSDYWVDWHLNYIQQKFGLSLDETTSLMNEKFRTPGYLQVDLFSKIDRSKVAQKYSIPDNKKVVLYFPLGLSFWNDPWSNFWQSDSVKNKILALLNMLRNASFQNFFKYFFWFMRGWDDRQMHLAIKEFCKNNNAVLIVKGREKEPFRPSIEAVADFEIYDDSYFPPTSLELISQADIIFHAFSTAVLEAAFFGVPSVTIDRPNLEILAHDLWRQRFSGSAFNSPGVVKLMTIPEIIQQLPGMSLRDFQMNPVAQKGYVKKFVGENDTEGGVRAFVEIDKALGSH